MTKALITVFAISTISGLVLAQSVMLNHTTVLNHTTKLGITLPPPIAPDGSVACSPAVTTGTSLACSLTSVTAGDLIVCNFLTDGFSSINQTKISDPSNGLYNMVLQTSNGTLNVSGEGMAYVTNAASGSYSVTIATSSSHSIGITCKGWKNVLSANAMDGGALSQLKDQITNATNPTAGTAQTPTAAGELIYSTLGTGANTPTAGASFTLLSGMAADLVWGEYQVLSGSPTTNCPYTMSTDVWSDLCTGFLPTGATGGITPLTGAFVDMSGLSNGAAPTTTTLSNSTTGFLGLAAANWAVSNTHSSLTGVTTNLCTFANPIFINGHSYTGTESGFKFQYATGTGGDLVTLTAPFSYNTVTESYCFETTIPQNDSASNAYSQGEIIDATLAHECNAQIRTTGSALNLGLEQDGGVAGGTVALATSTLYQIQMQWTVTATTITCNLALYNASGSQVGSTITGTKTGLGQAFPANTFQLGISGAESESGGHNMQYGNWTIDVLGHNIPLQVL